MVGFFAFVMTIVMGLLVLIGGLRFLRTREEERLPPSEGARFDRLESALNSLESRLDDLTEQQRFLERLLAERPAPKALGSGGEAGAKGTEGPSSSDVDSVLFDTEEGEAGDR